MEFSISQKGNEVLVYMGFEYLKTRTLKGIVTWKCRQSRSMKCHSILKTENGNMIQPPTNHCHDSCPQKALANIAKSQMKQDIKVANATPRKVMGDVLSELSIDVLAHLPKHSSIARNLLNHRKEHHLPSPTSVHFDIPEKYSHMILHDTGVHDPDRILVLGDKELLEELNKDTIYGDGTFDSIPGLFYQLYTWHAEIGNSYPPCLYVLLQKKDLETYNKMFAIMKTLLPKLSPRTVLVEFDKNCTSAVRTAFPDADIKGCYFHLCQSLKKKVNSVGLKTQFEADINTKLKLKSLAALCFVPPHDIKVVFEKLASTFPDEESYNEVLTHFFFMFIEGAAGRDPAFPARSWNHHDAVYERSPKTTNCCEGFHNTLNSLFHCSHPSVWFLFDGLLRDLAVHRLTLTNVQSGQQGMKKKKYEALYDLVAAAVQDYVQVEDKLRYLWRLANLQ